MNRSLLAFARDEESVDAARRLASRLTIIDDDTATPPPSESSAKSSLPFKGKTIVFTGKLSQSMTRCTAQTIAVEVLGAKSASGSVTKSTDVLVEGGDGDEDGDGGEKSGKRRSKKAEKAMDLGIRVMDASEFLELVEQFTTAR